MKAEKVCVISRDRSFETFLISVIFKVNFNSSSNENSQVWDL